MLSGSNFLIKLPPSLGRSVGGFWLGSLTLEFQSHAVITEATCSLTSYDRMVLPKVANAVTSFLPVTRIHKVQAPFPASHSHFCLEAATDGLTPPWAVSCSGCCW